MSTMTKGSLIGKLMVSETNCLNLNPKKENNDAFGLKYRFPPPNHVRMLKKKNLHLYVDNSLALIAKNFKKMLKKKNFNKPMKTFTSVAPIAQKGSSNSNSKLFEFNKLEGIRCREFECIRHIQEQCVNTLMKKKTMQST